MLNSQAIKDTALRVGFDLCGIIPVRAFADQRAFYDCWLDSGYGGWLGYLRRNIDKRFDPELLVPGAKSIVVCGVNYKNDTSMGYGRSRSPKVASYARSIDYHHSIKAMLKTVAKSLEELYGSFGWRAFTDSAPLLEKRAAMEAGLGWIGRNTLLITPHYGSFVLLGELVIDREVDKYDTPMTYAGSGAGCGTCTRCVDACPNNALTPNGIDTRKCISCITIEKSSPPGRIAMKTDSRDMSASGGTSTCCSDAPTHGWIFGCDECQSVCPYNTHTPFYANPRFEPLFDPREMTTEDWEQIDQGQFDSRFDSTPLKRWARCFENLEMKGHK